MRLKKDERLVEMIVCWTDRTWNTIIVPVDADLNDDEATEVAKNHLYDVLSGVAFAKLCFLW